VWETGLIANVFDACDHILHARHAKVFFGSVSVRGERAVPVQPSSIKIEEEDAVAPFETPLPLVIPAANRLGRAWALADLHFLS
jgi:hypothetical protein